VSGSGGTPTGSVTFKDGSNALGTGALNGSGVATFSTSALSAGSHSITAVYGGDTDFSGSTSAILSQGINKANATINVMPYGVTYDGNPHTATGTATGVNGEALSGLDLSQTSHTNADSYTDTWTFTDTTGNYSNATGTINDVIARANATIVVTPYDVPYDANPHTASGTAAGVGGIDVSAGLNLTGTLHTNAGTYTDSWTFTDSTGNYNNAGGTVTDVIEQVKPTLTWPTPADVIYGTGLSGTQLNATVAGVGGANVSGTFAYTLTDSTTPASGAVLGVGEGQVLNGTFTPSDPNYTTASGSVSINVNQASPRILWSNPADITYGTALSDTQLDAIAPALPVGVTGWWTTDENTGTTAHNAVGADNATLVNGASWQAGKYNSAFALALAQQQYVDAGNTPDLQVSHGDFSVAVWVYFNSLSSIYGDMSIVDKMGEASTANDDGWRLIKQSDNHFWFCIGQQPGVDSCLPTTMAHSQTVATTGQWYFLVATKSATQVSIYVNGNPTPEGSYPVGPIYDDNATNLRFGSTVTQDAGAYLDGMIDEPMLFNHALSGAEVQALYGQQPGNFAYTPATGTVLNAGQGQALSTTFTPTDAINYANATASVKINVNKANATITVAPYSVTYDGNSHSATGTATGVNGETLTGLALSGTAHTNAGTYADSWTFTDSTGNYNNASGSVSDSIAKANPTVSVTPYSVTYDGNPHTATGTATGVKGEALTGLDLSATAHTNAGNYTDGWTFTDSTGNYNNATGSVNDVITKANATINVTPYSVTYDGNAHTATGTVVGVKGEALSGLDLSGATHTNAGTYGSDPWVFTDVTGNYNNGNGTVSDAIAKANPTVNVTPYNVTYDGNTHTATGTVTGVKSEALSGLDLSGTTHTNAGDYTSDSWTFIDSTGNYNNANGTVHDSIAKANAIITVTGYNVTYDGNAHTVSGSATGVKGEALNGLDLGGTAHTNAGSFTDTWAFTDTTGNYNNGSGSVADVIAKANAAVTVTPYSVTYDGNPHTATGTAIGVKGEALSGLGLSGTTHTNAGTYATDSWTFTDSTGNYNNASGAVSDAIAKAAPSVAVTPYSVTYDGNSHTASASATGVKGEALSGLNLSGTTHTNAGDFPSDPWSFADTTGNYNNTSGTVHDSIAKASAAITVTPYSVTYDGNAHTATGSALGVKGESLSGLNLGSTTHTTAGTYADAWTFTDGTGNYNNSSGTVSDSIAKATLVINWSNPASIVYGTALGSVQLNATATGVSGALPGTFTYNPAASTVLPPGLQPLNVSFVPNDTVDYNSPVTKSVSISVVFATGVACNNGMVSHVIQPPIAASGTTVVKKGSTVPTKFAVCDVNGNSVGPTTAFSNVVKSYQIVSATVGTVNDNTDTLTSTTPDTAFRWDSTAQQWIYNTATGSGTNLNTANATYGFQITLIDGTNITFQYGLK
jgi:hypothetical protein